MTHVRSGNASCLCNACHSAVSRRKFLTTAASAVAAATVTGASGDTASAQRSGVTAAGRLILINGGCVLTLDRAVGDFGHADGVGEGVKNSAVQARISPPP